VLGLENEPLKIKRKYDDGNRVISIRIREEILAELDSLADQSNRSRNEIINMILEHGLKNIIIEWTDPEKHLQKIILRYTILYGSKHEGGFPEPPSYV